MVTCEQNNRWIVLFWNSSINLWWKLQNSSWLVILMYPAMFSVHLILGVCLIRYIHLFMTNCHQTNTWRWTNIQLTLLFPVKQITCFHLHIYHPKYQSIVCFMWSTMWVIPHSPVTIFPVVNVVLLILHGSRKTSASLKLCVNQLLLLTGSFPSTAGLLWICCINMSYKIHIWL